MIRGFYNARSGLIAHQERMNVISNNIANVNTHGFKPMRPAFKDLIYQNLNRQQAEQEVHIGHGVKVNKNDILISQGAPSYTGRDMDFCITEPNAFFAVMTGGGEVRFTRNGNFAWMNSDEGWYLVNGNSEYVLDREGEPILCETDENGKLPHPASNGRLVMLDKIVDADGTSRLVENVVAEFGIFSFENPYGLWSMQGTTFYPTPESGEPTLVEAPSVMNSYLENSAVEIAQEMASMIEAQRAFSFNSRMVMTSDEIEQLVNTLR
jgi:flagellar basal body rod protein FlgG